MSGASRSDMRQRTFPLARCRTPKEGTFMALYEHMLIARQDISAQAVDAQATAMAPAAVLRRPEDLPVLGGECAQDRLQGRQAAAALHFRARQDRAVAHHRGVREKTARAFQSHQAGALHVASALRCEIGA